MNLLITIILLVIAFRVTKQILRNKEIFDEYEQSKILALLAFLYPIGPMLLWLGGIWISIVPLYLLVVACYIPAIIVAMKQSKVFQFAGTDRVEGAKGAISLVKIGAFLGLINLAISIIFSIASAGFNA